MSSKDHHFKITHYDIICSGIYYSFICVKCNFDFNISYKLARGYEAYAIDIDGVLKPNAVFNLQNTKCKSSDKLQSLLG